jgi:TusA-related sulfurtransferase
MFCQVPRGSLPSSSATHSSVLVLSVANTTERRITNVANFSLFTEARSSRWVLRSSGILTTLDGMSASAPVGSVWERSRCYEPLHRLTKRSPVSAEVEREKALVELNLRGVDRGGPTGDTLAALKRLSPESKLAVITDYLPARQTIPRLVEQRGCTWQITEDDGKTFRIEIVKGE